MSGKIGSFKRTGADEGGVGTAKPEKNSALLNN